MNPKQLAQEILRTPVDEIPISDKNSLSALAGHGFRQGMTLGSLLSDELAPYLEKIIGSQMEWLKTSVTQAEAESLDPVERMFTPKRELIEEKIERLQRICDALPELNNELKKAALGRPADADAIGRGAEALYGMVIENEYQNAHLFAEDPRSAAAILSLPKSKIDSENPDDLLFEALDGQHRENIEPEHMNEVKDLMGSIADLNDTRARFWENLQTKLLELAKSVEAAKKIQKS